MQTPSALQSQFPLSPKKFWKKIISLLPVAVFLSLAASFFIGLFIASRVLHASPPASAILKLVGGFATSTITIAGLLLVVYGLYVRAYIKRYYYDSTDFITIKKGVFAPAEIHVQYQKIQDVYVDQDILDRILGIYDVHIASATFSSGIEAHIDGVSGVVAEGLKNLILGKIQGSTAAPANFAAQNASLAANSPAAAAINFNEEISSKTFPLNNKWYFQAILQNIFGSGLAALLLVVWFYAGKKTSPATAPFDMGVAIFAPFFIFGIIRSLIWKAKFYFAFLPQFVMQKTGVIATQEKHLPYKSIQDVMIKQSLVEKILGLSTVVVQNAANAGMNYGRRGLRAGINDANVVIPGQPIDKGQKLVEELNKVLVHRNESMGL